MILFFRFFKNRCFCHNRMCSPVRGLMWGVHYYLGARSQVVTHALHHRLLKALTSCYGVIIVFVKINPARKLNTGFYQWPTITCLSRAIRAPYWAITLGYCRAANTGRFLFPRWEHNIPTLGMKRSHLGNSSRIKVSAKVHAFALSGRSSWWQLS